MIKAAGVLFVTPQQTALFLKRGQGGDCPGQWTIPGGKLEGDESAVEAAIRETLEESGRKVAEADLVEHSRTVTNAEIGAGEQGAGINLPPTDSVVVPGVEIDFTTFSCKIDAEFTPTLCDEHTGYAWASVDAPPEPLHPGCRVALDRLTMDELGVAEAMVAGQLSSPQVYQNVTLFDIRITGTGYAFRESLNEYVYRDPEIWLTERTLKRCNGLAAIWVHPKKTLLNSEEYENRTIGSVFLPYIKGDDIWAITKVYDDAAIDGMRTNQLSTSPGVSFSGRSSGSKFELPDGAKLLIENDPSLIDHIAICSQGVWDKRGPPAGIIVQDSAGASELTDEEAKADRARKDAEEMADKARKDAAEKMDAKLDAVAGMCDSVMKRFDAWEKEREDGGSIRMRTRTSRPKPRRKDSESDKEYGDRCDAEEAMGDAEWEAKAKADAEEEEKEKADAARRDAEKADKARRDAEEEAKKADAARMDAALGRIADLEKLIPRSRTADERTGLITAQVTADRFYQMFGDSAPGPMQDEDVTAYRRRLMTGLKGHSTSYKGANLHTIVDDAVFDTAERTIYADAAEAAKRPSDVAPGKLRPHISREAGHEIIEYYGGTGWMDTFAGVTRRGEGKWANLEGKFA